MDVAPGVMRGVSSASSLAVSGRESESGMIMAFRALINNSPSWTIWTFLRFGTDIRFYLPGSAAVNTVGLSHVINLTRVF